MAQRFRPPAADFFAGAFLAVWRGAGFFAEALFLAGVLRFSLAALPPLSLELPRLRLRAAIKSTTFEPLGGPALAFGSSMTRSPLARCFSSIRRWSAST